MTLNLHPPKLQNLTAEQAITLGWSTQHPYRPPKDRRGAPPPVEPDGTRPPPRIRHGLLRCRGRAHRSQQASLPTPRAECMAYCEKMTEHVDAYGRFEGGVWKKVEYVAKKIFSVIEGF
ncbi:hypothetical protein HHI36_006893 [Cryptolaemus montrouzieri]|uniref:Uncharacterized protein n=1 Tax=Cryptolaemus montrouzieri TaxID=559131 RepID=A0ABD2MMY1_9CUCU